MKDGSIQSAGGKLYTEIHFVSQNILGRTSLMET